MPEIPVLTDTGFLPPGIYNATLPECLDRFGVGSEKREGLGRLLSEVVSAAREYPTIKRMLVWGSFVSDKLEPNDLDYSFVCSVMHRDRMVRDEHRRFLVPSEARIFYGVDRSYLEIKDYPIERFAEQMLFL
ncbi:MAG: hypothetical protein H8F28_09300 [Fibrella sp.]|nr:hypothetical protein [Armatimonadota bacterium]